jgi:hypothetical protein
MSRLLSGSYDMQRDRLTYSRTFQHIKVGVLFDKDGHRQAEGARQQLFVKRPDTPIRETI